MPFLNLPNKTLESIARNIVPLRDVGALSRVNYHRMHWLLVPDLYRRDAAELGSSALLWAAAHGHLQTPQYAVLHGGNLAVEDVNGQMPLLLAASHGHLLLVHCPPAADPTTLHFADRFGRTPLSCVAEKGLWTTVQLPPAKGASPAQKG